MTLLEHEGSVRHNAYITRSAQRSFWKCVRQCEVSACAGNRKNVLAWQYGFSEEELKLAKKQANRAKLRREITRSLLPIMRAEAAVESMARKAKRILT